VRKGTTHAVFNSFIGIGKITAAFTPQCIEGTVTKKAVEVFRIFHFMARKIFTITMLKKLKIYALIVH
jgi:hypothetical protein